MNTVTQVLHQLTHRMPGVPEHANGANVRSRQAARRTHGTGHQGTTLRSPNRHHQNPPRVLVAWQNRIARLVRAGR